MTSADSPGRWLFGAPVDLLIGCGGLYVLSFLVYPLVVSQASSESALFVLQFLMMAVSMPHYGGTLARAYRERADRRKYVFFTVYATIGLCAWFAVGTHDAWIGSWMATLYLTWSPWHYSGQNYGISLMYLRRRGFTVTPVAKRALWVSFFFSFLLAFLSHHSEAMAAGVSPDAGTTAIAFLPLGLPEAFVRPAFSLSLLVYLGAMAVAAAELLRTGSLRDLLPLAVIFGVQSTWFVIPYVAELFAGTAGARDVGSYVLAGDMSVQVAHGAQYLWITTYYAKLSSSWRGYGSYYGRVLVAGALVWMLPQLLFAPYALGKISFGAGLPLLVASLVNLHHFVLDGAIWKLRSGPVAAVLIRAQKEAVDATHAIAWGGRRWLSHAAWSFALAFLALRLVYFTGTIVLYPLALELGRPRAASSILSAVGWLGGDHALARVRLGNLLRDQSDLEGALREYERALALEPRTASAHFGMARILEEQGKPEAAIRHYRRTLELDPSHPTAQAKLDVELRIRGKDGTSG